LTTYIKNLLRPWKSPISYTLLLAIKLFSFKKVISGPFKGLKFRQRFPTKPMLLGVWEKEISFIWDSLQDFKYIIDIGAAEGYYAVGLAKRYPDPIVYAFEMKLSTQRLLQKVISDNLIKNIEIRGKCEYKDLLDFGAKLDDSLIVMDCEGYEMELLNDDSTSILNNTTLVVELHEMYAPGCTHELKKRFSSTHYVKEIKGKHRNVNDWPPELKILKYLFPTSLLLHFMDEGRPYPMNWLYMQPRKD
jgi:hypothetical protein